MQQGIKAIIFDFDGTLVDTVEEFLQIFLELGERYGRDVTEHDFYRMNGMTIQESLKLLIGEGKFKMRVIPHLLFNIKSLMKRVHDATTLYNHAHPTLSHLGEHYQMAIVTSNKRKHVEHLSKQFDIRKYFSHIITQDDVKKKKPNPEPFLKMANLLGQKPEDCLVIEDTPFGALAAHRAGMQTCVVEHTTPKKYFTEQSKPKLFIENLSLLHKDFIESNYQ